jgi:hypothetical protein
LRALERRPPQRCARQSWSRRKRRLKSSSMVPMAPPSIRRRTSSRVSRSGRRSMSPTIVAYEMNGVPLPHFNRLPARIIVPLDRHLIG